METDFQIRVLTPGKKLIEERVSEVVLPAFDGEIGVLAGHQDFIGLLGTGVLKIVKGGDDYWYVISSGVFEVSNGQLTVLVELGEHVGEENIETSRNRVRDLEASLTGKGLTDPDIATMRLELERAKARVEAHRRTAVLN